MLKKADYTDMLEKCQSKLNACKLEMDQTRACIHSAQSDLQEIELRRSARKREHEQLMPQVQAAHRMVEEARTYAGIATGPQAATQVVEREREATGMHERYASLQKSHVEQEQTDTAKAAELHKAIRQAQASLPGLESKFQALAATKAKLLQEQGEALYSELSTKLRSAEAREQDTNDEALRAQIRLAQLRAEAIEQLGRWPGLKQRLMREHHVYTDASTKALTAFICLLDILLDEGAAIDATRVPKPGTYSFLQEMVIKQEELYALANRYPAALNEKREKVAGILQQYQDTLARE